MILDFAPALLTHVHHPNYSPFGPDPEAHVPPFQVWVPNDSHIDMLHHLAYAYILSRDGLEAWACECYEVVRRNTGELEPEPPRQGAISHRPART